MRFCHVESCSEEEIPDGLKAEAIQKASAKYKREANEDCNTHHNDLDYLNKTISKEALKEIELWRVYDDAQDNFCDIDDDDEEAEYVDLLLNPERYTG